MRLNKKNFYEMIKFAINGFVCFIVDYSLLYLFTDICQVHYILSATLSFMFSVLINYFICVKWVFNEATISEDKNRRSFFFILSSACGLVINALAMAFLVEFLGFFYLIAKIIAVIIVMIWNYFTKKYILTKEKIAKENMD